MSNARENRDWKEARKPGTARVDPDNPPLTDAQLAEMRPMREVDPKLYQAIQRATAGKTRITIYLDDDVIAQFRQRAGDRPPGYQTLINQALREYLGRTSGPLDEPTLRRVLREEWAAHQDARARPKRRQARAPS